MSQAASSSVVRKKQLLFFATAGISTVYLLIDSDARFREVGRIGGRLFLVSRLDRVLKVRPKPPVQLASSANPSSHSEPPRS